MIALGLSFGGLLSRRSGRSLWVRPGDFSASRDFGIHTRKDRPVEFDGTAVENVGMIQY